MVNLSKDIVKEIEKRASDNNLPIARLCRMANISRSTFIRWKNGTISSPGFSLVQSLFNALEDFEKQNKKSK